MFYLTASAFVSVLLFFWLKERVLYLIFPWAYVQNFILAWMYTNGLAGKDLCQALLISKEFLLLWLFFYFLPKLRLYGDSGWPQSLRILALFTAWCVVRYAIAVLFQGQGLVENLINLRMACFPLQILTVAVGVASTRPAFAMRFIRQMTCLVGLLAALGIVLWLPFETTFWKDYVDYGRYSVEIKDSHDVGEDDIEGAVEAANAGVGGNGIARNEFAFLSPFRAIGTVGDAVGFGHLVAFPLLIFVFCSPKNWGTRLMLIATAVALFVSFTRSAWIFVLGGSVFVLLRKKRHRLVFGMAAVPVIGIALWEPMREWFLSSVGSTTDPDIHANGIVWFYQQGIWDLKYLFGHTIDWSEPIPEGGYGILLIRYGLPAVLAIIWFFWALYRTLRESEFRNTPMFLISAAMPLVLLLTMNLSAYPFSFIAYLLPWFVVGTCLAFASQRPRAQDRSGRNGGLVANEGH